MTIPPAPACATLSVEEAAAVLGVSRTKLYALLRSGCVPHLRFGRTLRIPSRSFDEWMSTTANQALDASSGGSR
jgi:excisionase family DNA binding protein